MEKKKTLRLRKNDIELLAVLKAHIETLLEPIPTIKELSKKFGINTDKLKKGFKQLYGKPLHRYHLEFKMEVAKKLLAETDHSIDVIAAQFGYNDANNFSAAFRKVTGKRPGEWRNFSIRK